MRPLQRLRAAPPAAGRSRAVPTRRPAAAAGSRGAHLVLAALLAWGLAGAGSSPARAEEQPPVVYKWIDEHGVAHYTTDRSRIPASIRDRIEQRPAPTPSRGSDWLLRDAGEEPPPAAPPLVQGAPDETAPATAAREPAEAPGDEVVHGYHTDRRADEAPGAEAAWAPGELGDEEDFEAAATGPADAATPQPIGRSAAPAPAAALEADGTPVPESVLAPAPETAATGGSAPSDREVAGPAAVAARAPLGPEAAAELAEIERRIAEVEAEIARDEETLMTLLGGPAEGAGAEEPGEAEGLLFADPVFREIAQRLPQRQAELEALRQRRARIGPDAARP